MTKKSCDQKDYQAPEEPKYSCKKCNRVAKKEEQVCKPVKIKKQS